MATESQSRWRPGIVIFAGNGITVDVPTRRADEYRAQLAANKGIPWACMTCGGGTGGPWCQHTDWLALRHMRATALMVASFVALPMTAT